MHAIGADVWQLPGPDVRLPGGVRMPLRSTVIRLPDRSLVLYSPITVDEAAAAELAGLGEVAHVVAPNRLHHLHVAAAAARWPNATVHAPPGLAAKRPDLRIHRELGGSIDPSWRDVLDVELIGGVPSIDEAVLLHRPTGTLICADLFFHVTQPANLRTRALLALVGAGGGRLAQSRAWRLARRDRSAARRSVERILDWPVVNVSPCHGDACAIDVASLAPKMSRLYGGIPSLALASGALA